MHFRELVNGQMVARSNLIISFSRKKRSANDISW